MQRPPYSVSSGEAVEMEKSYCTMTVAQRLHPGDVRLPSSVRRAQRSTPAWHHSDPDDGTDI